MSSAQSERPARYAAVAVLLHWTIAALIVLQIVLVDRMEGRSPAAFAITQLHKSIGITVLLLSLARLGWRLANPPPPLPPEMARWERVLAHVTHVGFYVIMIGMPLTGWVMVSTSRIPFPTLLFGVVPWPSIPGLADLTGAARHAWHEVGEAGHGLIIKGFYVLIALHVAGALKHQFVSRDAILARMLPGAKAGRRLEPRLLAVVLAFVAVFAFGKLVQPPHSIGPAVPPPAAAVEAPVTPPVAAPAAPEPQMTPTETTSPKTTGAATETPAAPAAPVAWKVDKASTLGFETTWGGDAVKGRFTNWTADVLFSPDALDKSRVSVSVDMAGVESGDAQRDAALPTEDFFDAKAHPRATFTATRFEKVSEGRYVARGKLSLRGVSLPLALPFSLQIDGDKARVRGVTSLDRTAFGVGQGEWANTEQIPAKVTVRVDLTARR